MPSFFRFLQTNSFKTWRVSLVPQHQISPHLGDSDPGRIFKRLEIFLQQQQLLLFNFNFWPKKFGQIYFGAWALQRCTALRRKISPRIFKTSVLQTFRHQKLSIRLRRRQCRNCCAVTVLTLLQPLLRNTFSSFVVTADSPRQLGTNPGFCF